MDFQPYVCTYEFCNTSHSLYVFQKEWVEHEDSHTFNGWQCFIHTDVIYDNLISYQMHLIEQHPAEESALASPELLQASRVKTRGIEPNCPLCGEYSPQMAKHIGDHLIEIALFTLPRDTSDESDDSGDSDRALPSDNNSEVTRDSNDSFFKDYLYQDNKEEDSATEYNTPLFEGDIDNKPTL